MKETILITAATGNIGSELTGLLATHPNVGEVQIATRNPESQKAQLLHRFNPHTVKPVHFDIEDKSTITEALKDVTKICLITPLSDKMVDFQQMVVDEAKKQGIHYIVKISVDAASPNAQEGPGAAHWAGEEMIRKSRIPPTMLRPTIFMQHFLIVPGLYEKGDDTFYLPTGDGKIAFVDCRDIAYAMSELLLAPEKPEKLENDFFFLTGPTAVTGNEIVEELSNLTGKSFTWNKEETAFDKHSEKTGSPAIVKEFYKAGAAGYLEKVETKDFEKITGKMPNSFARFAWDNRYYFV
ncbi:NmrA family NAD(P)-binding protein [Aquimarina celericrescens]|uniref:NmrA family NAD(P)-binding protein n=1 Tax=Aquimarina celericrescens TaxID=1964542 RepID=A0ABW5AX19_9FLAO|nr:NmrA family NAD(P)-binding protein [Aquimarina celericrescens]